MRERPEDNHQPLGKVPLLSMQESMIECWQCSAQGYPFKNIVCNFRMYQIIAISRRAGSISGEETVPSQEDLQVEKYIFRDYIVDERYRGLKWLSIITLMAIWVTGVLNKDSPLAP